MLQKKIDIYIFKLTLAAKYMGNELLLSYHQLQEAYTNSYELEYVVQKGLAWGFVLFIILLI